MQILGTKIRRAWALMALCLIAGLIAWFVLGWSDWVKGWAGTHFKLLTGGTLGWITARYFLEVRPSTMENPIQQGFAGLTIGLIVGLYALGAAIGV